MTDKKPDISSKATTAQIGQSEDFVLPIAPPPPPAGRALNPGHLSGSMAESSPTCAASDGADGGPVSCEMVDVSEPAVEKLVGNSESHVASQGSDTSAKLLPWFLVLILVFLVIGLLLALLNF